MAAAHTCTLLAHASPIVILAPGEGPCRQKSARYGARPGGVASCADEDQLIEGADQGIGEEGPQSVFGLSEPGFWGGRLPPAVLQSLAPQWDSPPAHRLPGRRLSITRLQTSHLAGVVSSGLPASARPRVAAYTTPSGPSQPLRSRSPISSIAFRGNSSGPRWRNAAGLFGHCRWFPGIPLGLKIKGMPDDSAV